MSSGAAPPVGDGPRYRAAAQSGPAVAAWGHRRPPASRDACSAQRHSRLAISAVTTENPWATNRVVDECIPIW